MAKKSCRLTFLEYGALMALSASGRATCPRAKIGCALFSSNHRVAATGYNGVPAGQPHCDEVGCLMVDGHCSRTIHAERSACGTLDGRKLPNGFAFVTLRPCKLCFDAMVTAEISNIFYLKEYRPEDDKEYIERICKEKRIIFQKLKFDIKILAQKFFDFHCGPGGLLVAENRLRVVEKKEGKR